MAKCKTAVTPLLTNLSYCSLALSHRSFCQQRFSLEMNNSKILYCAWQLIIEAECRIYASVPGAIIGSDNGLSPVRRQAIIWTNAGSLLIGPLATSFIEIWNKIKQFSFTKMRLKMSSGKWWPFCLGRNVLNHMFISKHTVDMWWT